MRRFLSLLKKEALIFFSGSSAYFLMFIYLVCSIGGAFYFGDYLTAEDSSVYSLFSLQPYILAVIIPAVTMKSWAEEYKSNTAEFLLTLPVALAKFAWAKLGVAFLFFVFISSALVPFIIYSALYLKLDWLNIFSAYFGLELIILLFCSFGCFISSLSKNLIVTYALSMFLLLFVVLFPQTMLIPVYRNFLFGEVGLFEIFYCLSFSALFLYANLLMIKYRQNIKKSSRFLMVFSLMTVFVANVVLCWSINVLDHKADLTSGKFYTLKHPTKQIIKQITKPVKINLFMAEDYLKHDKSAAHYFEQISRFLKKYQTLSNGMIKVSFEFVPAYSDLENALIDKGFYYVKNSKGSKNYFGAVVSNSENSAEEVITMFLPQRVKYLEEDVDRAVLKTAFPELKKAVGIYFDGEQNLDEFESAALILENEYNTALLDNTSFQISKNAQAVVLFNPKILSPVFLYALDQYVVNGGNLLIFIDRQTQNQLDAINDRPLTILKILNNWGIKLGEKSTDEGVAVKEFSKSSQGLLLHSAFSVEVENQNLAVKNLISDDDKILGVIAKGKFKSYYEENPFKDTPIANMMRNFKSEAKVGQVAVIGDVDILNETNWVAENSPDRDRYSIIEKSGNGRFFTAVADYMVGNNIYAMLPQNDLEENFESISEIIDKNIVKKTEAQYLELEKESADLYLQIWQIADFDEEKIPMVLDLTDVGRKLQSLKEQMNGIEYERAAQYNDFIRKLMLLFVLFVPLIETLAVIITVAAVKRNKNKFIKELIK